MAVDISGIQPNRTGIDTGISVPISDGILNDQVRLEIQHLLKKEVTNAELMTYLASQSSRLTELQSRPSFKAMSGDLPPPSPDMFDEKDPTMQVTDAELESLEEFAAGLATADDNTGAFLDGANSILDRLREQYGDPQFGQEGESTGGIMDWLMVGQLSEEAAEIDEKWAKIISAALKGGDAISLLMAYGEYFTEKYGNAMGEAFKAYSAKQEAHQLFMAEIDLEKGAAVDMFKAQQEMASFNMDSQMAMQSIQDIKRKLDTTQNMTKSSTAAIHEMLKTGIRNLATR